MPLPELTPDTIAPSSARMLQRRLRGMEENLDQYVPQIAMCQDGMVHLAWASLLPRQADTNPHDPVTPHPRLPGLLDDMEEGALDIHNASMLHRLESRIDDYGIQGLNDTTGVHTLTRANPIGIRKMHDFQVVWLDRKWVVCGGAVRWVAYNAHVHGPAGGETLPPAPLITAEFERCVLQGGSGWIALPITVQPLGVDEYDASFNGNGYILQPSPPVMVGGLVNSPPQRVLQRNLVDNGPPKIYRHSTMWGGGRYMIPIARVHPPRWPGDAPYICQILRGSLSFWNGRITWDGALQRPFVSPLAHHLP